MQERQLTPEALASHLRAKSLIGAGCRAPKPYQPQVEVRCWVSWRTKLKSRLHKLSVRIRKWRADRSAGR